MLCKKEIRKKQAENYLEETYAVLAELERHVDVLFVFEAFFERDNVRVL